MFLGQGRVKGSSFFFKGAGTGGGGLTDLAPAGLRAREGQGPVTAKRWPRGCKGQREGRPGLGDVSRELQGAVP